MQSLIGTWQLIHTECIADNGDLLPPPYAGDTAMGLVSLREDGRMICVLCDSRTELPTDGVREYNSYCGNFRIDGKQLVTRVDTSANPDWIGTDQIRDVSFDGETLILRPVRDEKSTGGQRILHWKKLPSAK